MDRNPQILDIGWTWTMIVKEFQSRQTPAGLSMSRPIALRSE